MANARIDVAIGGSTSGLDAALARGKGGVNSFASSLSGIAGQLGIAFGVGTVISLVKRTMEAADETLDLTHAIGMTVDQYAALKRMADQAGLPVEKLNMMLERLGQSQATAIEEGPAGKMAKDFAGLGVSFSEIVRLDPAALLARMMEGAEGSATAMANLNAILGKRAAVDAIDAFGTLSSSTLPGVTAAAKAAADAIRGLAEQQKQLNQTMAETKGVGTFALNFILNGIRFGGALLGASVSGGLKSAIDTAMGVVDGNGEALKNEQKKLDDDRMARTEAAYQAQIAAEKKAGDKTQSGMTKAQERIRERDKKQADADAAEESRLFNLETSKLESKKRIQERAAEQIEGIAVSAPRAASSMASVGALAGSSDFGKAIALYERQLAEQKIIAQASRETADILGASI